VDWEDLHPETSTAIGLRERWEGNGIMLRVLSILLLILLYPFTTFAQVTEAWMTRHNGPGNGYDGTTALVVDSVGNVYVTGESSGDYLTIRYDTNGNQLWTARYNGPGNGNDIATTLAVDSVGNVYVSGYSTGSGSNYDYATIKYDPNGNQLWVARYNGPENGPDSATAIAVDTAGNAYVTGNGVHPTTIKYDTNGNQLWVAPYTVAGSATAVAVDQLGSVYVTGNSYGGPSYNYTTIKYDTNGIQLWTARYGSIPGQGKAIALDTAGYAYVTGIVSGYGDSPNNDIVTVKYDANGQEVWESRYDSNQAHDRSNALAVDSAGNVYVTGETGSLTYYDYITIKYDPSGVQLWAVKYDGGGANGDHARAIAVDHFGNVYVTGNSDKGSSNDFATIKYDSNGIQLWVLSYNGPGNGSDIPNAIALDSSGNIYVTGSSYGSGTSSDSATIKYYQFPPAQLPRTGQTTCYDSSGAVTPCAGTGQDGEIQAGLPWPEPRFNDNGDGTITDGLTGLMWTKNANLPGTTQTWQQALDYVQGMNAGTNSNFGHTDWRVPNINELKSLLDLEKQNPALHPDHPFTNLSTDHYLSSTSFAGDVNGYWLLYLTTGWEGRGVKSGAFLYPSTLWPVRSERPGVIQIPKTGQITSSAYGDDGDIEKGVPWPTPRFTDNSDNTVTDNLTGLIWTKSANLIGTTTTRRQALDYIAGMNTGTNPNLGYMDWRLPNRKELESLIDHARYDPAVPIDNHFNSIQSNYYWSSTSDAVNPNFSWIVNLGSGQTDDSFDPFGYKYFNFVWPVRGGHIEPQVYSISGTVTQNTRTVKITFDTTPDGAPILSGTIVNSIYASQGVTFKGTGPSCGGTLSENVYANSYHPPQATLFGSQPNLVTLCPQGIATDITEGMGLISAEFSQPALKICIDVFPVYSDHNAVLRSYDALGNQIGSVTSPLGVQETLCIEGTNIHSVQFSGNGVKYAMFDNLAVSFASGLDISGPALGLAGVAIALTGSTSATTTAASDGTYSFTNLPNGNYAITPFLSGYTFSPTSRSVTIGGADVAGVDFTAASLAADFTVSASPSTQTVDQGGSASHTVFIADMNGFSSPVTLSVGSVLSSTGTPEPGIGAEFSVNPVTPPGTTALTITPSATVPSGSYTVEIQAVGGGQTHTTSVTVTVTIPVPDFTIVPDTGTTPPLKQGGSVSTNLMVNAVGGFDASAVIFRWISQLPDGINVVFDSNPTVPGQPTTLTIDADTTAELGRFSIAILAEGGGIAKSQNIDIVVQAPGALDVVGRVTNYNTLQEPVPGAEVVLFGGSLPRPLVHFANTKGAYLFEGILDVSSGAYQVEVTGHVKVKETVIAFEPGAPVSLPGYLYNSVDLKLHPKACDPSVHTRVYPLESDNLNNPDRTPLVLIHGISGIGGTWNNLIAFINNHAELRNRFKIYLYDYQSNVCSIQKLGQGLRDGIDGYQELLNANKPMAIVAHSMGGLVARSYMNEYRHQTDGTFGGQHVSKLITLATPHHGTVVANEDARDNALKPLEGWRAATDAADLFLFPATPFDVSGPNRDLRSDDFDGYLNPCHLSPLGCESDVLEENLWLINLNGIERFAHKIVAYRTFLDIQDPSRIRVFESGVTGPAEIASQILQGQSEQAVSYLLERGLKRSAVPEKILADSMLIEPTAIDGPYAYNDGVVPVQSADFSNVAIQKVITFCNFTHTQLPKAAQVFGRLRSDLLEAAGAQVPPVINCLFPMASRNGPVMTIYGDHFAPIFGTTTVTINGTSVPVEKGDNNKIQIRLPSNVQLEDKVRVVVEGISSNAVVFRGLEMTYLRDQPDPFSPNGDGNKDSVSINVVSDQSLDWTLKIPSEQGSCVNVFTGNGASFSEAWNPSPCHINDGLYYYEVSGKNGAGDIVARGFGDVLVDNTPPTAPPYLTAFPTGSNSIEIRWNAVPDGIGIGGYHIYRDGDEHWVETTTDAATSYVDTGLAANSSHTYTVTAVDSAGNESTKSPPASATTYNTHAGNSVTVSPRSGTSVMFSSVSSPGNTTVTTTSTGPTPPAGFQLGDPPTYYDVSTTATFTPPITVCFTYDPSQYADPIALHLFHYENAAWVDVTTSNNATNHVICGQVSSLSPFAVFAADRTPPTISAVLSTPANAAGWHSADVTVSFTCADAETGIVTCSDSVTISTEGTGEVVKGTAVDAAGNSASTSVTVNLDKTAPMLSCPLDVTVFATEPSGIPSTRAAIQSFLAGAVVTDNLDASPLRSHDAPSVFPVGQTSVMFSATDQAGHQATCGATMTVINPPPVMAGIADQTVNEVETLSLIVSATDSNGDVLAYSATGLPTGATFNPATHTFTYAPGYDVSTRLTNQIFNVVFTVSDGSSAVSQPVRVTVRNVNRLPVASAGVDQRMECAGAWCPLMLDGTGSTDPDSSPGTQDDIAQYRWYERYGAADQQLLGTGDMLVAILGLGLHTVTLEVTDQSGAIGTDTVTIALDPARLSLFVLEKAEVDWPKTAGGLADVKLHGRLALPVGLLLPEVAPRAQVGVDLAARLGLFTQTVAFEVKGGEGETWEYKANPPGAGIQRLFIHWKGAKFNYSGTVHLKTESIALDQTALSLDRGASSDPVSFSVNGVTASIDGAGGVTASVPYEVDEDGEITFTLPFELTPEMEITLTVGTQPAHTLRVGNYYTPGSGKFEINAKVNVGTLTGASRPATLGMSIALGNEGYPGSVPVSEPEWKKLSTKEWKAELKR
jgi:pimeloyl-ACP methyl ester carboxylesterase